MKRLLGVASVFLLWSAMSCFFMPSAMAGTYKVRDCFYNYGPGVHEYDDTGEAVFSRSHNGHSAGIQLVRCGAPAYDYILLDNHTIEIPGGTYPAGTFGRFIYSAPDGAGITGVSGLLTDFGGSGGFIPRLKLETNGAGIVIAIGSSKFSYQLPSGMRKQWFEAELRCSASPCSAGYSAINLQDVIMTIDDYTDPAVVSGAGLGGTLFAGGYVSGVKSIKAASVDLQSGVFRTSVIVNGWNVASNGGSGCESQTPYYHSSGQIMGQSYRSMTPCPYYMNYTWQVDTRVSPFVNGANDVRVCARDRTDETACTEPFMVYVSN